MTIFIFCKIKQMKAQPRRFGILVIYSAILAFPVCGCRVTDIVQTRADREYMQTRPLMDGEVKRLRQTSYWDFSWVNCVKFSPDGNYIIASYDNKITLWDVASGKKIRNFEGHQSNVWDVVFSPNLKFLASCSEDKTVRLWDFDSGKEIRRFSSIQSDSRHVCFSPDGSKLAAVTLDTVSVWETENGHLIHRFNDYGFYTDLAFSRDGKFLNAVGRDGIFCTWNLQTSTLTNPLVHLNENLFSPALTFSADGSRLAIGEQQTISVWNAANGHLVNSWHPFHARNGWAIAISPDGRMAVHASHFITIWSVETGKQIWQREMPYEVESVNFSPDDKFLVTGAEDGSVRIWKAPILSQ